MADDSITTPRSSLSRLLANALKYGGVAGVIGGLWTIADYALGFQTEKIQIGKWTSIGAMVVPIAAVILGMMTWRNKALGGRIRFAQAFGMALAIGLTFSTCIGVASWAQAGFIAPGIYTNKIEHRAVIALQFPDVSPDDVEKWKTAYLARATPLNYAKEEFAKSLFSLLVISLIASITMPKQRPGVE